MTMCCRSLINLCLAVAFLVVTLATASLLLPSASEAKDKCDCSNLKTLQIELRNAIKLQEAFRNKANELRTMAKGASIIALKQFAEGDARRGLEPIPGNKGPSEVDYTPWGRDLYDAAGNKYSAEKLCAMTPSSIGALEAAIQNSECPGIGEALREHEKTHINFCQKIGYLPYDDMHGADRAMEEVEAYGAQIKALRAALGGLQCGYRARGQIMALVISGVICSLEKPFTLNGKTMLDFTFNFTLSATTAGNIAISVSGHGVTGAGSGTYRVEGIETDQPRIAVTASYTGWVPQASASTSGTFNIDLSPLEGGECAATAPAGGP